VVNLMPQLIYTREATPLLQLIQYRLLQNLNKYKHIAREMTI